MFTLTRPQRKALKAVYDRQPLGMSYREFRKTAQPLIAGQGCIMVPWFRMWLGIETDGHTHS